MKTNSNYQQHNSAYELTGASGLSGNNQVSQKYSYHQPDYCYAPACAGILLTEEASGAMFRGTIPGLEQVCHELYNTFFQDNAPFNALQFIPVLKKLNSIHQNEAARFYRHPKTNYVLVQHDLLKIVLIQWKSGKYSSIHGHPKGGCVFKVLHGKLEEKRYSPDESQRLLAVSSFEQGSMAYIDDDLAHHAVGNPFNSPAISLHVYTNRLR